MYCCPKDLSCRRAGDSRHLVLEHMPGQEDYANVHFLLGRIGLAASVLAASSVLLSSTLQTLQRIAGARRSLGHGNILRFAHFLTGRKRSVVRVSRSIREHHRRPRTPQSLAAPLCVTQTG